MKTVLAFLLMGFISIFTAPVHANDDMTAAKPKLILFYSDYCGNCKILEPKLEEAFKDVNEEEFHKVTFDYTDRERIMASKELAAEENLTDLQKSYGAKTGFVVITDADGNEIAMLSSGDDVETLKQKLNGALGA